MDERERQALRILLKSLIYAQDTVSHLNELGPDFAEQTCEAITARDEIRHRIVRYVDSLIRGRRPF